MEKTLTVAAQVAKEIRKELKQKFPCVKFSVTSKSYSGGNSVDVSWDMRPSSEMVNAVVGKYQHGSFDGMTDSYDYNPTIVSCEDGSVEQLQGVKFVFAQRRNNQELNERIGRDICRLCGVNYVDHNTRLGVGGEYVMDAVWRVLRVADLTNGYHGVRSCDTGFGYEIY